MKNKILAAALVFVFALHMAVGAFAADAENISATESGAVEVHSQDTGRNDYGWTDLIRFVNFITGEIVEISAERADVNNDGIVDIEDVILIILNYT